MPNLTFTFFERPSSLWHGVVLLRMSVFVDEMNVPVGLELDNDDMSATHLAVATDDEIVGTLRLVRHKNVIKIGRVAIATGYRHQGLGTEMMQAALEWCRQQGVFHLQLGSQTYITDFYTKLGFIEEGNVFMDAGIPHVLMSLQLSEKASQNPVDREA